MIPEGALAYVDSSVLARAIMADEAGHDPARAVMRACAGRLATWVVARVEVTGAMHRARQAGRLSDDTPIHAADTLLRGGGPLIALPGASADVVDHATRIAGRHAVRALDAMHIATALTDARRVAGGAGVVFITADGRQGQAAEAEGLPVHAL